MPELMEGALVFGLLAAVLSRIIGKRGVSKRRLPFWATVLVTVAAAYVGPPVFAWVQTVWRASPILPDVKGGMVFIGLFALTMFESKDNPRRVPIWAGVLFGVVVGMGRPPLIDKASGTYQRPSFRIDVNECTRGMRGQVQPRDVTNICDFQITVGICLPGELNPAPCAQSVTLVPGEGTSFDPGDARLSSAPGNRNGLTVVAYRPPHRPSRARDIAKRNHDAVCLPGLCHKVDHDRTHRSNAVLSNRPLSPHSWLEYCARRASWNRAPKILDRIKIRQNCL